MGVPLYGIVALVSTATDKQGRSVPAPGQVKQQKSNVFDSFFPQGILSTAGEQSLGRSSPLLSVDYRRKQLELDLKCIDDWHRAQLAHIEQTDEKDEKRVCELDATFIEQQVARKRAAAFDLWGHSFYKNDGSIAPLRGALAVFGLTVDDIEVAR